MTRSGPGSLPFHLLVITDAHACTRAGRGVVETVARAVLPTAHGCAILVRDKERDVESVALLCAALRPIARRAGALLLVHGHVALVRALELDGVHLPSDADARAARHALGPASLLGVSRHGGDPLDARSLEGVDYVALAPVFKPTSKAGDTRAVLGTAGLALHAARSTRPLVALGGIDARNAREAREAGAGAVAVIGAVMGAHEPRDATLDLLNAHRSALKGPQAPHTRGDPHRDG